MFKKLPALYLLLFTVVGILFADICRIDSLFLLAAVLLFGLLALFTRAERTKFLFSFLVGLMIFAFAAFRFAVSAYDFGQGHISNFTDSETRYTIYGEANDWVSIKNERTEIQLSVDSLKADKVYLVHGNILVRINIETTSFQRNDKLILDGQIYPVKNKPFSADYDYQRYLSYKGIAGVVYLNTSLQILTDKGNRYSVFILIDYVRDWIRESFYKNLDSQAAALASGFLIGETRGIAPELYQRFKDSGTLHLLAVSGSNVVLVLGYFLYLLRPFSLSKKRRTFLLLIILVLFVLLSYEEPSVVRASVMAGLVLLAGLFERRYDLNNIIALSALLILLAVPTQLFNLGFQLSFIIAWGLIVTLPQIAKLFDAHKNKNWYRFLLFPFIVSFVAQIYSTGLVGLYFDRIPLLAPFANLIIVPLVSLAVIGIQVLLTANFLLPVLGKLSGALLKPLFAFTIDAVELFGGEGMIYVNTVSWQIGYVVLVYILLFYLSAMLDIKRARRTALIVGLLIIILAESTVLYNRIISGATTQIEIMSVPGGSVTLLQHSIDDVDLVVHGMSARKYNIDEKILKPELTKRSIKRINKLFILSADYHALDDLLRVAAEFSIQEVFYYPGLEKSFLEVQDLLQVKSLVNTKLIPATAFTGDGYFVLGDGLCFKSKQNIISFTHSVPRFYSFFPLSGGNIFVLDQTSDIDFLPIGNGSKLIFICAKSEQVGRLESIKSNQNLHLEIYMLHDSDIPVFRFPQ